MLKVEEINGVSISIGGVCINHLFFAYDCILFSKATKQQCRCVREILEKNDKAYGQKLNIWETSIYFKPKTSFETKDELTQIIGARVCGDAETYICLPSMIGKSKYEAFINILRRG